MTTLYTAKKYAVPALEAHCVEFLKKNLRADNAFMLLTQVSVPQQSDHVLANRHSVFFSLVDEMLMTTHPTTVVPNLRAYLILILILNGVWILSGTSACDTMFASV